MTDKKFKIFETPSKMTLIAQRRDLQQGSSNHMEECVDALGDSFETLHMK
jgi:hypothetical protein